MELTVRFIVYKRWCFDLAEITKMAQGIVALEAELKANWDRPDLLRPPRQFFLLQFFNVR